MKSKLDKIQKASNILKFIIIIFIIYINITIVLADIPSERKTFHPQCKGFLQSKKTSLKAVWGNYDLVPVHPNNSWPEYLIVTIVFSPDGKKVLSGQAIPGKGFKRGGDLKLWNSSTGQEICSLHGHTRPVNSISFSPDGVYAVSASDDGTIRLWDILSCKEIQILKKVVAKYPLAMAVDFSPTDNVILIGISEKPSLKLLDSITGKEIKTFDIDWNVRKAFFSPDGKYVLSINTYDEPSLWDAKSGKLIRKFYRQARNWSYFFSSSGAWTCGCFSPDGRFVLCGSSDGKLRLWETISGKEIWSIKVHKKSVNDVTFSPNGTLIISTSDDATLKIINTADSAILDSISLTSSHDIGKSLAFAPDGAYFLVGTMRGVILQFSMKRQKMGFN